MVKFFQSEACRQVKFYCVKGNANAEKSLCGENDRIVLFIVMEKGAGMLPAIKF